MEPVFVILGPNENENCSHNRVFLEKNKILYSSSNLINLAVFKKHLQFLKLCSNGNLV